MPYVQSAMHNRHADGHYCMMAFLLVMVLVVVCVSIALCPLVIGHHRHRHHCRVCRKKITSELQSEDNDGDVDDVAVGLLPNKSLPSVRIVSV